MVPFDCPAHSLQETVLPQTNCTDGKPIQAYVEKFTDSKNAIFFRSMAENNEIIAEKTFKNSGVTRRLWTLGRLDLTLVVNQHILLVII